MVLDWSRHVQQERFLRRDFRERVIYITRDFQKIFGASGYVFPYSRYKTLGHFWEIGIPFKEYTNIHATLFSSPLLPPSPPITLSQLLSFLSIFLGEKKKKMIYLLNVLRKYQRLSSKIWIRNKNFRSLSLPPPALKSPSPLFHLILVEDEESKYIFSLSFFLLLYFSNRSSNMGHKYVRSIKFWLHTSFIKQRFHKSR